MALAMLSTSRISGAPVLAVNVCASLDGWIRRLAIPQPIWPSFLAVIVSLSLSLSLARVPLCRFNGTDLLVNKYLTHNAPDVVNATSG